MQTALESMAKTIVQRWLDSPAIAFVGVHKRGVPFAQRLALLAQQLGKSVEFGKIDITPYRDDLQTMPIIVPMEGSELPFDVDDAVIILCDEVIYTGRTTRAALDELLDYGRPRCVQFAALIDRAGRELPIQPDYTALKVDIPATQKVRVQFTETDGVDEVFTCARDVPA